MLYFTMILLILFIIFVFSQSFVLFPESFVLQLTICIAVPTTLPNRTFGLNLCVQVNYNALSNISQLSPTVIQAKSNDFEEEHFDINRKTFYGYIRGILDDYIFTGEECLKKLICETAANTIDTAHKNSLLEKILLYIATPSKDVFGIKDTDMQIYHEAEKNGKLKQNCMDEYNSCHFSILDLFTNTYLV